jgi:hypothetical protein
MIGAMVLGGPHGPQSAAFFVGRDIARLSGAGPSLAKALHAARGKPSRPTLSKRLLHQYFIK